MGEGETDGPTKRKRNKQIESQTDRHTDGRTDLKAGRVRTNRQIDCHSQTRDSLNTMLSVWAHGQRTNSQKQTDRWTRGLLAGETRTNEKRDRKTDYRWTDVREDEKQSGRQTDWLTGGRTDTNTRQARAWQTDRQGIASVLHYQYGSFGVEYQTEIKQEKVEKRCWISLTHIRQCKKNQNVSLLLGSVGK